jgi:alpha-L-arabinofuranosidase
MGKVACRHGTSRTIQSKRIGVGNEQWGPLYPERLEQFVKQIRAKYPNIKICGTSGPSSNGDKFDYGWQQMRKLKVDLVDEHYYMAPDWFLNNAGRYDKYPRKGPKVFAGEYASHVKGMDNKPTVAMNDFEAALSEAAFMTGLERNADVVYQATLCAALRSC